MYEPIKTNIMKNLLRKGFIFKNFLLDILEKKKVTFM